MQSFPVSEELMGSVCLAEGVGGLFHDLLSLTLLTSFRQCLFQRNWCGLQHDRDVCCTEGKRCVWFVLWLLNPDLVDILQSCNACLFPRNWFGLQQDQNVHSAEGVCVIGLPHDFESVLADIPHATPVSEESTWSATRSRCSLSRRSHCLKGDTRSSSWMKPTGLLWKMLHVHRLLYKVKAAGEGGRGGRVGKGGGGQRSTFLMMMLWHWLLKATLTLNWLQTGTGRWLKSWGRGGGQPFWWLFCCTNYWEQI